MSRPPKSDVGKNPIPIIVAPHSIFSPDHQRLSAAMADAWRAEVEIFGNQSSGGHNFTILVLCDGEEPKRRALDHIRRVAATWTDDFVFEVQVWPLSASAQGAGTIPCDELAAADLLILALEHLDGLGPAARHQLCAMFQRMRCGSAAVAVLTMDRDLTVLASLDFLHAAATQAGIDFIFPLACLPREMQQRSGCLSENPELQPVD